MWFVWASIVVWLLVVYAAVRLATRDLRRELRDLRESVARLEGAPRR